MAKNINSISFTVLLLVLLMASTEILKSEAACGPFIGECGSEPFSGTTADCFACCVAKYGSPPVCEGIIEFEGTEAHCHCYGP